MGISIKELIPVGERILQAGGVEEYKLDAESLLCFEIGFDKKKIFMNWTYEVDDAHVDGYLDKISRRAAGEPLQYITGEQYFMGRRFAVGPTVLIPRPETESLTEKAIQYLAGRRSANMALDLCTGSGAIAVSLALKFHSLKVTASDISKEALVTASRNARAHGVAPRIEFVRSNLFSSIKKGGLSGKKFDLIISNPPYIRSGDIGELQREIREHEPMAALDGGEDGLDFYRKIAAGAKAYMKKDGCLMLEIGADQGVDVRTILENAEFREAAIFPDLSGRDRIAMAHK
jgi:release factor glutamine methyltransferase